MADRAQGAIQSELVPVCIQHPSTTFFPCVILNELPIIQTMVPTPFSLPDFRRDTHDERRETSSDVVGGRRGLHRAQYSTRPTLSGLLTHPTPDCLSAVHPRRAFSRARIFPFSLPLFGGVAKAALDCAHRKSTVSSCAFCEQGGHLAVPSSSFRGRAFREHR